MSKKADAKAEDNGRIENKSLGVSFVLPERISVRQQLQYRQAIAFSFDIDENGNVAAGNNMYVRYWKAAQIVIIDWQCEIMPVMDVDIDEVDDFRIADIIQWTGNHVAGYMADLRTIPKNS